MYALLQKKLKKSNNETAFYFYGTRYTFGELAININLISKSLIFYGIKEGDTVCLALPNIPQAIYFVYAINKIGAVTCMIHPLDTKRELNYCIKQIKPKMLIMFDAFAKRAEDIDSNKVKIIVTNIGDDLPFYKRVPLNMYASKKENHLPKQSFISYSKFINTDKMNHNLLYKEKPNNLALILSSGGTTGKKKFVSLTNRNVDASVWQISDQLPNCSRNVTVTVMPLFHGNGLIMGVHAPLNLDIVPVLIPRFSVKTYIKNMLKYQSTIISATPSLLKKLINNPMFNNKDLSFLKTVFSGADSLSKKDEYLINDFLYKHKCNVNVRQGYGLTEAVVVSIAVPMNCIKYGSIGQPLRGVKVRIVKPNTSQELKNNEVGEIAISSDTVMSGYFNNPEETSKTLKKHDDGFTYLHTGDLGYKDSEGFIYFKGRIKRMIVTNGYNVYPLELENTIEKHKYVSKCLVVGKHDENRGEIVEAYIKVDDNITDLDSLKKDIIAFMRDNISKYSIPRNVYFVNDIPLTNIGKIDYKQLNNHIT